MTLGESAPPTEGSHDYVLLRVGTGRYAVAMGDVGEIGRSPHVTRMPGLPAFVAGMANWRGSVLAVLDARELLGATGPGAGGHLAVLRRDDVEIGLRVDAVDGVLSHRLAPVPATVTPRVAVLLAGTLLAPDGQPVAVLDVGALVALRAQLSGRTPLR
jgi:purine-binding chemotaxis protein CheW